ncbi:hypothetical protein Nmel_014576 [Mimus melanotis]
MGAVLCSGEHRWTNLPSLSPRGSRFCAESVVQQTGFLWKSLSSLAE